jgi:hypothetical protein
VRITFNRRRRNTGAVLAVALVVSATVIWKASFSAFVVTTQNPNNAWVSGNLVLEAQNGLGAPVTAAAVLGTTGLIPGGAIADRCLTVVYSGNITAGQPVHVYSGTTTATPAKNGHSLGDYVTLQIDQGTTAAQTDCTGFGGTISNAYTGTLSDFTANRTNFLNGSVTAWTPAVAATTRSYRFRLAFPTSGVNATDTDLMAQTVQTTMTWEVQS